MENLEGNVPELTIKREPHMLPLQIAKMREILPSTRVMLEYGAGGSTHLAASMGVQTIVSVESDKAFAEAVVQSVKPEYPNLDLTMLRPDIGPTGAWGSPQDPAAARRWPEYVIKPWEHLTKVAKSPDLVLVDGRFRVGCFLMSLLQMRPGTTILFDDYNGRRHKYGVIEKFIEPSETIEKMAVFEVKPLSSSSTLELVMELARYCVIPD